MHFFLSIALFYFAWIQFRYQGTLPINNVGYRYNYYITLAYAAIVFFFYKTYNAYLIGYWHVWSLVFAQCLSQFFSVAGIYFIVSIAWNHFNNPLALLILLIVRFLFDVAWSIFGNRFYYDLIPPRKTLLTYRNALDRKRFGSLVGKPVERIYHIADELMYDGTFQDL